MRTPSRLMPKCIPPGLGLLGWLFLSSIIALYGYALYKFPWVIGALTVVITVTAIVENRNFKTKLTVLAAFRRNESICTFAKSFNLHEVDTWVIRAVYEQLQIYLASTYPQFPVRAEDALNECLITDPDDLDLDLVEEIAKRTGRSLVNTDDNPYYGNVKTVRDLVLFFNAQPRANET